LPFLTKKYYLNFYGGEPLLSFDLIKEIISFLKTKNKEIKKKANYSITTNGILLTKEIIKFLNEHHFSVVLSFDGKAQNIQRKKGSSKELILFIEELLKQPNINLEVNSVFTPATIDFLTESMEFIMALEVPNIRFALSTIENWDEDSLQKFKNEIKKLRKILLHRYKSRSDVPIVNFREANEKGIFFCAAGRDRVAITPEGKIWGCFLFPDYFKGKEKSTEYQKFFFGTLNGFKKNHKNIYRDICSNYSQLSMDNFSTSSMNCLLCPDLEKCSICPINAAFSSKSLGKIPVYLCQIQKIKIQEKEKFKNQIKTYQI